jgi:hypothetical protein
MQPHEEQTKKNHTTNQFMRATKHSAVKESMEPNKVKKILARHIERHLEAGRRKEYTPG